MLMPERPSDSHAGPNVSAVGYKSGGSPGKARVRPAPAAHLVTYVWELQADAAA